MPKINQYTYEVIAKENKVVSVYAANQKTADKLMKEFVDIKKDEYRITDHKLKEVITDRGYIALPWANMEPELAVERQKEVLAAMKDNQKKQR